MVALFRRLLGGIKNPQLRLWGAILLSAGASGASIALMGVSAWLLSRAAELPPVMYLLPATVGVRFFGISRGVLRYLERLVGHDLGLRMQSALRLETYARLAQTTLLGRRRGDLLTRIVADVDAILDLVVRVFVPFMAGGIAILGTSIMLGVFSPGSGLALLASSILAGVVAPWLANRLSHSSDLDAVPARGDLADVVHEISRCAPDLVAHGAEGVHLQKMVEADLRLKKIQDRAAWVRGVTTGFQVVAAGIAVIASLLIGGQAVVDGRLDRTMLAVLVLTPLALHEVLSTFTQAAQTFTRATVALERVEAVLDAPPIGVGDLSADQPRADEPSLIVRDLSIGWPDNPTIASGLDFTVGPGERVAVVGPSGIGKTTLAATVLGLIPPVAGEVSVEGRIGYLAQDAHIFATSLSENVKIGNRDATDDEVKDALTRAGLDLSPDRVVGELGASLSGGEARRVALARLMVGEYQVLVLDEPSEHLDPATADALLDDIWATAGDRALLVVTHDPGVVARCDRVVRLAAA